jgi:ABC-type amino acid transport substrate-binding protein
VVRKTDTSVSALSDLRGRRVGAQKGTTGEYLAKNTEGALVFRYDDIAEAFEYLLDGELDAVVNDCPSTRTYLRSHEGLRIADPDLDVAYYAIAVPRNSPELLTAVNEALAVLIGDGTYDSLHLRWFGYSWSEEPACDSPGDSLNQ